MMLWIVGNFKVKYILFNWIVFEDVNDVFDKIKIFMFKIYIILVFECLNLWICVVMKSVVL